MTKNISISIDKSDKGQNKIDVEVLEVKKELDTVFAAALKKYKTVTQTTKFFNALEKQLSDDVAQQYVSVKLMVAEKLLNKMLPGIIESLTTEAAKFTKARLEKEANTFFDNETHSVMLNLLGMTEDRWDEGNLTVDNCNGRKSAITDYIRFNSSNILDKITKEALADFDANGAVKIKEELSTTIIARIQQEVNESLYRYTTQHIQERTDTMAADIITKALENHDTFKSLCSAKSTY